jgi:sodium/potassium-transporting ATPase subunit beta
MHFSGKILLFYWVFYACLIGFLALNYYLFTRTLLESEPTWTLDKSLLGTNPGLTFRPSPDPNDEKYAIVFKSKNDSGAKIWYNQLSEVIKGNHC